MKKNSNQHKYTNSLINESSPYLLQHAHNPVNWHPWNLETLALAKKENKLLLISIGYSACHWCHVMEKECFESEEVALIMNKYFINIKVDREERPDVDMIYMQALQLITGRGGWPLNCIALPDAKPIYGGTYFSKNQWLQILNELQDVFVNQKVSAFEYAEKLIQKLKVENELFKTQNDKELTLEILHESVNHWKQNFDNVYGGPNHSPKFPLPNNYLFLLKYGVRCSDNEVLSHVQLSLDKMMQGGIYDQVGGGFARYSVDSLWKIPHFEKMLYDNAQLISLYSEAYKIFKNKEYKRLCEETISFVLKELQAPKGLFYSALDADTEGEEGKFYVWKKDELTNLLKDDFEFAENYFNINDYGYWEHENYVLIRNKSDVIFCVDNNLNEIEFEATRKRVIKKLYTYRSQRIQPGLDDKSLTSWNAMMILALIEAGSALSNEEYIRLAEQKMNVLITEMLLPKNNLQHSFKNGKVSIDGFLEDYATIIESLISLYLVTSNENHIYVAKELLEHTIDHFYDENSSLFYFTAKHSAENLILRKFETQDNVIPASNSIMAHNLFRLGVIFCCENWKEMARNMIQLFATKIKNYGSGYSNYARLMIDLTSPFYEVIIIGKHAKELFRAVNQTSVTNALICFAETDSNLPIFENRNIKEIDQIYICTGNTCMAPVSAIDELLEVLNSNKKNR